MGQQNSKKNSIQDQLDPIQQEFNIDPDENLLQLLRQFPKTVCTKPIVKYEIFFKCYNCSSDNENKILCLSCFDNGSHRGHRILYWNTTSGGSCDCGLQEEGNNIRCKFHSQDLNIDKKHYLEQIPTQLRNSITNFMNNNFKKLFTQIESNQQIIDIDKQCLEFFQKLQKIQQSCAPLALLIAETYQKPLDNFKTTHQCSEFKDQVNQTNYNEHKICECSLLENIFRYQKYLSPELEQIMEDMQLDLYFEQDYIYYSTQTYAKMIDFFLDNRDNKLTQLIWQFQNDSNLEELMSNSMFKQNLVNRFRLGYKNILCKEISDNFHMLIKTINCFYFIAKHRAYKTVWPKYYDFLLEFISCITYSRPHFEIDIKQTQIQQNIDKLIMESFIIIIQRIFQLENNKNIINQFIKCIIIKCVLPRLTENEQDQMDQQQQMDKQEQDQNINQKSIMIPIFDSSLRPLSILLTQMYLSYGLEKTKQMIIQFSGLQPDQLENMFEKIVKIIANKLLFLNKLDNQNNNMSTSYESQMYKLIYGIDLLTAIYQDKYLSAQMFLYECDFGLLQIAALFTKPDAYFKNLSEGLQIDINNINPTTQDQQLLTETLVHICIDELPIANMAVLLNQQDQAWVPGAISKAIVNSFFLQTIQDYKQIDKTISLFVNNQVNLQNILFNVADLNKETGKFNLKASMQAKKLHEPYIWHKNRLQHFDMFSKIQDISRKDKEFDSVIGTYLKANDAELSQGEKQENIFYIITQKVLEMSNVQNMIIKTLNLQENAQANKDSLEMLKVTCKLFYILLLRNSDRLNQDMPSIFYKNTFGLISNLLQMQRDQDPDFENTLLKVKDLVFIIKEKQQQQQQQQQGMMEEELNPVQLKEQNSDIQQAIQLDQQQKINKKEEAKKKAMAQLQQKKQQFLIKSKIGDNFDDIEEQKNQSFIESGQVCLICSQPSQINNILVALCYISEDNLAKFYINGFVRQDEESLSIQSCNHLIHLKCYQQQINNKKSFNMKQGYFNQDLCSQCKFQSNHFIINYDSFCLETYFKIPFAEKEYLDQQQLITNLSQYDEQMQEEIILDDDMMKAEKQNISHYDNMKISSEDLTEIQNQLYIFNQQLMTQQFIQKINKLPIIYQKLLIHLFERSFVQSMKNFFAKNYPIVRSLILNIKIQKLKLENQQSIQLINQNKEFINFKFCVNKKLSDGNFAFDDIWINQTILYLITYSGNEQKLFDAIKSFSILYLHLLILFFAFLIKFKNSNNNEEFKKYKDILVLEELYKKDEDLQRQVQSLLMPYSRLMTITFASFFQFRDNNINQINQVFEDDDKEMNAILKFVGFEFLHINRELLLSGGGQYWNLFFKDLVEISQQVEKQKLFNFLVKNPCVKYKVTDIYPTYQEMHQNYFFNRCYLCKSMPQTQGSDLHICLICGQTLCSFGCCKQKPSLDQKSQQWGNLTQHAMQNHCENSVYMNLQTNQVLFSYGLISIYSKQLYYNPIGESFKKEAKLNWNDYKLDKKYALKINDLIYNRQVIQHFQNLLQSQTILKKDYFENGEI